MFLNIDLLINFKSIWHTTWLISNLISADIRLKCMSNDIYPSLGKHTCYGWTFKIWKVQLRVPQVKREWEYRFFFGQFLSLQQLRRRFLWINHARKYGKEKNNGLDKYLRDYDLAQVCTSKCDDAYIQCVYECTNSECLLGCNRDSIVCTEGKLNSI